MIRIDNISFAYSGRRVINDLSLQLRPGEVSGLLGLNGEGKTTLMKLMAGLIRPGYGMVSTLADNPALRHAETLADIYFFPEVLRPMPMSLRTLARQVSHFYPRFSYETLGRLLQYFDVDDDVLLTRLSMGQLKKAYTCLAFACNTRLLLLDEPTNGLDIPSKMQWRRVVAEQMGDERSILISSHQVRDIENMLDRVLILSKGRIIFNNTVGEIGEKLDFAEVDQNEAGEGVIYSVPTVKGHKIIRPQMVEGCESRVDLEMLFSAVLSNETDINNAINR